MFYFTAVIITALKKRKKGKKHSFSYLSDIRHERLFIIAFSSLFLLLHFHQIAYGLWLMAYRHRMLCIVQLNFNNLAFDFRGLSSVAAIAQCENKCKQKQKKEK